MTVTDDERREVATRLRANAKAHPHMGLLLNFAFADKGLNPDGEMEYNVTSYHAALRLADLIEPEERTCHMRDAHWDDGQCTWGCICSECGAKHEHESGKWMNYCPNCGAKVTEVGQ